MKLAPEEVSMLEQIGEAKALAWLVKRSTMFRGAYEIPFVRQYHDRIVEANFWLNQSGDGGSAG